MVLQKCYFIGLREYFTLGLEYRRRGFKSGDGHLKSTGIAKPKIWMMWPNAVV